MSVTSAKPPGLRLFLEWAGLLAILGLAAYLRLANLPGNPGWYSDEGTVAEIARNFSQGRNQYFALTHSILLTGRVPLFPFLVAGITRLGLEALPGARYLAASLSLLSVILVFMIGRCVFARHGAGFGLLAALLFAIYPQAVLYNRMGFTYNLLSPLILGSVLALWEYLESRKRAWLILASLLIGLGTVADLTSLSFLAVMMVVISAVRWKDMLWSLPLSLLPLAGYSAAMLLHEPAAFLFDLRFTLPRFSAVPWWAQFALIIANLANTAKEDPWFLPSVIGMFLLRPLRGQRLLLVMFLGPLFLLGRTTALAGHQQYHWIPFFPSVAVGVAGLLWTGVPVVLETLRRAFGDLLSAWGLERRGQRARWLQARLSVIGAALGLFAIGIGPLVVPFYSTLVQVRSGFQSPISHLLVDAGDARHVIEYLNDKASADTLTIASPAIGWALAGRVVDFQLAVAATGRAPNDFPGDIPPDRFAFDARLEAADWVVVDPIWHNWAAVFIPEVAKMVQVVQSWPEVFRSGEIEVFQNPNKTAGSPAGDNRLMQCHLMGRTGNCEVQGHWHLGRFRAWEACKPYGSPPGSPRLSLAISLGRRDDHEEEVAAAS